MTSPWPLRAGRSATGSSTSPDEDRDCYQTVGYIEPGEYAPSLHLALRLARNFDLSVEAVFALDAFGPLGADALATRPAGEPDRR